MKRDRRDDEEPIYESKTHIPFFQASRDGAVQYGAQVNQRNIHDFPDFIQYLLRRNILSGIHQFIPQVIPGDDSRCSIDSRKLIHRIHYGWDQRGRPFVCLKLNGNFNDSDVLILYCNTQNCWKYCTCSSNCIITPFEYDENNSKLGDFLTNPQVSCLEKIRALGQPIENHHIRTPAPDF